MWVRPNARSVKYFCRPCSVLSYISPN
jgi:hypothetical protein